MGLTFVCGNKQPTCVPFAELQEGKYFTLEFEGRNVHRKWKRVNEGRNCNSFDLGDWLHDHIPVERTVYPVTLDPITYRHKGADDA